MRCLKRVIGVVVIVLVAGIIVMYSGVISVAATNPHAPLTAYVLSTTMDNSVRYHAKDIRPPPLDDSQMVMEGFRHYRGMCAGCHLAPGMESSEIRQGLTPEPPKLQEVAAEWRPAELFWLIQNGVKMSGMPAWGPTHSDDAIWAIVAFLQKLPGMTAQEYEAMGQAAGPGEEETEEGHDGDDAGPHGAEGAGG